MTEKYYLYLDESGNFWENDPSEEVSPSLVGGVLCQKELADDSKAEKIHSNVVQSFLKFYPQYKDRKVNYDHATEAAKELKTDAPELKLGMVEATIKAGYIPVVFQQKGKHFLGTNTTTYIMFLVEGLIKLIEDRKIDNLTVVIGERLDLDKKEKWLSENPGVSEKAYKGPYIDKKEIISEYNKFMALAKIREAYAFNGINPVVSFVLANDKENRLLILCDYVCNTYLTGASFHKPEHKKRFQKLKRKSRGGRTADEKYQVYKITETKEAERLKRYIADRNYGEALFFSLSVDIDDEEFDRARAELTEQLAKIKGSDKKFILDILYSKVGRLIQVERSLKDAVRIIDNILQYFNEQLTWQSGEVVLQNKFFANLYLYKMAALTHMGKVKQFKNVAAKCEHYVKETRDIDFYLMYENRWIVNLQDIFQYKASWDLGQKLFSIMEKYAVMEKELEEKYACNFSACLDQLPKIANSLVLTAYFTLNKTHDYLEEARRFSDIAIKYFSGKEVDIVRAYQNRAQVEAEAGNFAVAIQYLNKGLQIDFENLTDEQIDGFKQFDWYHITKFLERLIQSNDNEYRKLAKIVIEKCRVAFKKYADEFIKNAKEDNREYSDSAHPGYVNLAMMGFAMVKSGELYLRDVGFGYLQQAYCSIKETKSLTFKVHSIVILFKMLSVCGPEFNKKKVPELRKDILDNVKYLDGFAEYNASTPVIKELQELCSKKFDKETVEMGARLVLM